jgi:hypothetical protein
MEKIITHKDWLEIFPEAVEYLEKDLEFQLSRLKLLQQIYSIQLDINRIKKLNQVDADFAEALTDAFDGKDVEDCEKRIKEINRYIYKEIPNSNRISQQDIDRAKEYPFENLLDFKKCLTVCPFHQEKTPSFRLYKNTNTAYCFGCGWSGDTIKYVMETEKVGFIQAVKRLK